ncbi:hypothetical protein K1T71_011738 [Dendrolimus kikuchii]|uniref:Uncharacterized protein n=1 Tax=Dendrolimus kikuchii TaxID=765133 RepID=A0ACC1CME6_9NEOP|nr:hypothetical protein K1T71_011738 [Dendrolimus kikuchii]
MISPNTVITEFFKILQASSSSPLVRWILSALALSHAIQPTGWSKDFRLSGGERFDFIVVGSGSAGAIVAARLSEVPQWNVLLLEAGGDPPPTSVVPSLFSTLAHTEYDWDYKGQLDQDVGRSHSNSEIFMIRGKMLGGSSGLNYLIYSRGVPQDYDEWSHTAPGWDWYSVLEEFKKLENLTDPSVFQDSYNANLHSKEGLVKVSRPNSDEINEIFLNSFEEMGIKRVLENNGRDVYGVSPPHFTFAEGRRSSTAEAYLKSNINRPNLFVAKHARVTKILVNQYSSRAYGVEVLMRGGRIVNLFSNYEIIVSAGSIDSPKLLMLSGIGPRQELSKLNIDSIVDLPVGKNLHDHPFVPMLFNGKFGTESALRNLLAITKLDSFPVPLQCGFFKLNNSQLIGNKPEFQIFNAYIGAGIPVIVQYGCKIIINYDDSFCNSLVKANALNENAVMLFILLHPRSRGQLTLKSKNPLENPNIELGFFRDESDLATFVEGVKYIAKLANTTYFRKVKGSVAKTDVVACRHLKWGTDEYWRCFVKNTVGSMLHPVGTCKMGPDGVVDERLRVHGVAGLRVADASIMPTITSGNTNAPAMMIGEKAASMIKQDYRSFVNF